MLYPRKHLSIKAFNLYLYIWIFLQWIHKKLNLTLNSYCQISKWMIFIAWLGFFMIIIIVLKKHKKFCISDLPNWKYSMTNYDFCLGLSIQWYTGSKIIESCVNINSFYKYFLGGLKQILLMKKNFIIIQIWVYPTPE